METIRVVKYAQLGGRRHRCWLCLVADVSKPDAPAYAVAIRLNDYMGHRPGGHCVTSGLWTDKNLRRLLAWRSAENAEAEFAEWLAAFPTSARLTM